jgi:hypothetical protein
MTSMRTLPQSFVGGELSSRMFGRPDDPKYQNGAARLRNMLVEPSGCARNRPGTQFVRAARNPNRKARLIPFRVSQGDVIQVEFGLRQEYPTSLVPGYARFHSNAGTVLHSRPWDAATAYVVGDMVMFSNILYRCILAHTNQSPPHATYWFSHEYVTSKSVPPAVAAPPVAGITTGTPGSIFFGTGVNHSMSVDEPIELTGDGGAPTGLVYGTVYYANPTTPERIEVRATPGGASLAISSVGTGTVIRVHRHYTQGEMVTQAGGPFYCRTTRPISGGMSTAPQDGNETYWYLMPSTGEYELPTTMVLNEPDLMALTYSQNGDTLSIANRMIYPAELRPLPADAIVPYLRWLWTHVSLGPPLPAPTGLVATDIKRGNTLTIASIVGVGPGSTRTAINTPSSHKLVEGLDFVFIEGSAFAALNDKHWAVENGGNPSQFVVINPDTGDYLTIVGTPAGGGTVRVTRLNSDLTNSYVVTAVSDDGRESLKSSTLVVSNHLFVTGSYNVLGWNTVTGAVRYYVYKLVPSTGLYGRCGTTETPTFRDQAAPAEIGLNPPIVDTSFPVPPSNTVSNPPVDSVPAAVTHYQGRRGFGGTNARQQDVWLVRANTESDLTYTIPVKATDRIQQRLKGRLACSIRHMVPLGNLVVLTDTTEFRVSPVNTDALTPDSFAAVAQSYVGAAPAQPVVMQNVLVFAGAYGGHVYQMGWNDEIAGYRTTDLCERSPYLFDGSLIEQMTEQRAPLPLWWGCNNGGLMLSLTFVPSQQVLAWTWHDTGDGSGGGDFIESVSVGREGGEERLWMVVRRTIGGVAAHYIEQMARISPVQWNDSWFVDCGLRYTGAPKSVITGLSHLEGKTVSVFADGKVQTQKVVAGGQITLDTPASSALVGLPIVAELTTLPATFAIEAYGSGRPKNVSRVWTRVEASGPFLIGSSPLPEDMSVPEEFVAGVPFTGVVPVRVTGSWTDDGSVFMRNTDPTPFVVVSITAELAIGD